MGNKTREEGYYWVKRNGEWQIAFWFVGYLHYWTLGPSTRDFKDADFEEIDENRIERDQIINPAAMLRAFERSRKETDDLAMTCQPPWKKKDKKDGN